MLFFNARALNMKSTVLKEEFEFFSRFLRRSKVREKVLTNFFSLFSPQDAVEPICLFLFLEVEL